MRQYLAGRPANSPLWPGSWKEDAAEMLRADLEVAGIPYRDQAGRYFDFHAMRGQFISLLAAKGVHPKVAQVLARHSTITLTMDYYTHLDVLDVTGALEKLPGVPGQPQAGGEGEKGAKSA
jgi:integrase